MLRIKRSGEVFCYWFFCVALKLFLAYVNLLFVKHTSEQDLSYTGDITYKVFKKSPSKMVISNKYKIVYFINSV